MIQSTPVKAAAGYPSGPLRRRRQALWLAAALALAAFAAGLLVAGTGGGEREVAERFARAWAKGDAAAMRALMTPEAQRATPLAKLKASYQRTAATVTLVSAGTGEADGPEDGVVSVPVAVRTRIFGTVRETLRLPLEGEGDEARIAYERHHMFPGLREGERVTRRTRLPTRAAILAADGTLLAGGPDRASEDPELAASIAGELGPVPPERARELRALGVPTDAQVGLSGLERALDDEVRGRPGGVLKAGPRTLAVSVPQPARDVRSTIDPAAQRAAVEALAGRIGGAVALNPDTGAVTAAAGIGLSGLQPPGSTFKIITLAGALDAGITRTSRRYPVETATTLEGVELENANGESCGGTLLESFAHSCNSVFAPMGAELGAERLVEAAEAFGFNAPPGIDGAATSVIPPAGRIGDDLAVGSSAIGQGLLQASALQMAVVAATIARDGMRPVPTLVAGARPRRVRAIPARTARTIARAMRAVVRYGTGTAAALDGMGVAGKTGTAELRSTVAPTAGEERPEEGAVPDPTDTTAWFAAYAPSRSPRVAASVMLVEAGAGGETAAPATRILLAEGVRRRARR